MKSRRASTGSRSSWPSCRSSALALAILLGWGVLATGQEDLSPAAADLSSRVGAVYREASQRTVHVRGRMADEGDATTSGTGAILTESGIIVTCAHVIEGATDLEALFANGRRYRATLLGVHPRADVALLSIQARKLEAFPVRAEGPRPGDWVLALGYPGGAGIDLSPAPAIGRVQQTGYNLPETVTGRVYNSMIATDVPMFQGNSGGPLIDLSGNLVGINAAISVGDGQAYAIPIDLVLREFAELKLGKTIEGDPPQGRPSPARPTADHARASLDELFRPVAARSQSWIVRILDAESHLGYGVVADAGGLIVCPRFLVAPYRKVQVRFDDGRTLEGTVGATDHRYGLTLVQVPEKGLAVPEFAPPDSIQVGTTVVSVGSHRRVLGVGFLGSIGREIQKEKTRRLLELLVGFDVTTLSPPADLADVLQHDTPLALGDLGSPLVDVQGRLVGINVANNVRGASYAPAALAVRRALAELAAGGDILPAPRPFLGVDLRELTPEEIEGRSIEGGLLIEEVLPGFTAEKAGLARGDVLVALGGVRIRVVEQLAEVLGRMKPGAKTVVRLVRDGAEEDVWVVLDQMP